MSKLNQLQTKLDHESIDGLLITNPYNLRYITNFTGSSGVAIVTKDKALFITDFRYTEQATKQSPEFTVIEFRSSIQDEVRKQVEKLGIQSLGFEKNDLSFAVWDQYKQAIKADFIPTAGIIEDLRMIKTADELAIIREAADIADLAFKHIIEFIAPGKTEIEVANELEFFMRKCGATSSSFDIIVASGVRSALPHGVATDKVIEKGDFVTLDYGALHKGYISDITRTVAVGEPSDQLKEIYQIVLDAQLKACEQLKSGMTGIEADALARDYIVEKGYGDYFGHSLGHGIGLEVHESPSVSFRSEVKLLPNMVVTIEPGIYLPGIGGVRIEDDVVVTESGNERLTHSTKELFIL